MANNSILASDKFTSGSLAAGWSAYPTLSECQVITGTPNVTEANVLSTTAGQAWTGLVWPDHTSEVTVQTLTSESGTILYLGIRTQSGAASGYYAEITNGTAGIYIQTNGTGVQIGSNVTGLTFASGDVWDFQASGNILSLYQNNKLLLQVVDSAVTYSSGSPSFLQFSSVNLAHCQVSSWRGYNTVQQDGVWTKQGVVVKGTSAAFGTGLGGVATPCVIQDTNAQILSGTVYKMWYCSGQPASGTHGDVWYAESSDGKNWTLFGSNPVISGYLAPVVIKVGSTYYLYAQPNTGPASANFAVFTSTNGTSWTLQNNDVIGLGTSGAWDASSLWQFCPVCVNSGTWYALYTAGGSGQTYYANLGLATSPNGLTGWTKYASNPVLNNFGVAGNPFYSPDGGTTWYVWGGETLLGRAGPKPNLDPLECVRYKATNNFTTWSSKTKSIHNSQLCESVNGLVGGTYIAGIQSTGNQTLAWSNIGPDGSTPVFYQIALQTAPAALSSLVQFNEDGNSQTATDAFTSGSGPLDSNWTTTVGFDALQVVTGPFVEAGTANANCGALYTGTSFSPNQYAAITLNATSSGGTVSPYVRGSTSLGYGYYAVINGPVGTETTTCNIQRYSTSSGQVGPKVNITANVGDIFLLSVVTGSDGNPILSLYQNGFLILQVEDYSSAALTSGNPGIYIFSSTVSGGQISGWAAGNANAIPNYPLLSTYVPTRIQFGCEVAGLADI